MLLKSVHADKKKGLSAVVGRLSANQQNHKSVESEVLPVARPVGLTAKRRRFTTEYKLRLLEEADQCTEPGQIGLLLRRECI